ncbi:MAG: polyketide synthase dehydratase domain-containing protein, partial [Gammaproteobacteria bacterium]|nr:polyketide synthase dehydratase domain-containing protein [Gammaproteobacteria bacterium]
MSSSNHQPKRDQNIAIIGMACLFPKARDLSAYWNNILGGVCGITDEPMEAWGADRYYDPQSKSTDRIYTKSGGFLRDLYRFNPAEFGIMPNSVDGQEPDQFLALKIARDALADAGYFGEEFDHTNTGIILGHSTYLHRAQGVMIQHSTVLDQTIELLGQLFPSATEQDLQYVRSVMKSKLPPFTSDTAPGVVPNVMTGRIANRLNLQGPNYIIDAACASSLLAVQAACEELRTGRSDLMLAGGVNASIPAEAFMVFTHLGGLSRSSTVNPFGSNADGTLLGEGLGAIVLKRLEDAERDGDRIYATVKAVGQSSDGKAMGLLAPRMEGEVLAIERAYRQSGIDPQSISLIEAHGTGIPLGDRTEIQALRQVMGDREGDLPRCAIGSVKSMISHCIPAAGVAGLIKTALALYHKVLPPTLCEQPNPDLNLESSPFYLNTDARAWIHPSGMPRRGAVNAFGFGGVNSHAVLEEYQQKAPAGGAVTHWGSELILLDAHDRHQLLDRITRMAGFLDQQGDAVLHLRDIAFTSIKELTGGQQKLALIASDIEDLLNKLQRAADRLKDTACHRLQTRNGVFFADKPLNGKMAFMFPGEGAQYQQMLADLTLYFPVVREWFDFWESIYLGQRQHLSSYAVFPPPTCLTEDVRHKLERDLFGLEIGSESMFIASQAVFSLLKELGLQPDGMLGHSSGENSALVASGLVQLANKEQLRNYILTLNKMYHNMEAAGDIAKGALLTVGAVAREKVRNIVENSNGKLFIALDNCYHQTVLFGPRDAMEQAAEQLRKAGGLCAYLPFDRAYHTPLFAPVSEAIEKSFADLQFRKADIPVYSCVNADVFPSNEAEIRHHAAIQWSSPVLFTETIERMYADGYRFFVEVGPAGNLASFVDDILRDHEHLGLAANNRSRPGLAQLQQMLGRLFVNGKTIKFEYLYEGRNAEVLDFDKKPAVLVQRSQLLANTMPYIRLNDVEIGDIKHRLVKVPHSQIANAEIFHENNSNNSALTQVNESTAVEQPAAVISQYFTIMQEFLAQQERVLTATIGTSANNKIQLPFIQNLLHHDDEKAEAEVYLNAAGQRFLREHILYASEISDFDATLHGLAVVPFTVSLEMLAEIASVISPEPHLVALENVKAYNWIALDEGEKVVRLESKLIKSSGKEAYCHAAIYDGDSILLEGNVVFSADALDGAAPLPPLEAPQEPVWQDHELYTTGMFHGPLYHSIRHLVAWDKGGIDAELCATPTNGFFYEGAEAQFLINPVLMDAVGHLTAFWIAQQKGTDFSCFPSQISRIELIKPAIEATEDYRLRGRLAFMDQAQQGSRFLEGEYDCIDSEGKAVFRIFGWRDRFFDVPHSFYVARTNPREGWYGEDWSHIFPHLPAEGLVWYVPPFPSGFLEDAGAVWKRLLVHTVLSHDERQTWNELPTNPKRRNEWLMGRIALKEVVRAWIANHYGVLIYPADISISVTDGGKPFVSGVELEQFGPMPQISLAHAGDHTVA